MLWGNYVAGRLRLETHTQQCQNREGMLPASSDLSHIRSNVVEKEQSALLTKIAESHIRSNVMGKKCCWEVQIRVTSAAVLKRKGKECCWQVQI